jgi:hypothetical protein
MSQKIQDQVTPTTPETPSPPQPKSAEKKGTEETPDFQGPLTNNEPADTNSQPSMIRQPKKPEGTQTDDHDTKGKEHATAETQQNQMGKLKEDGKNPNIQLQSENKFSVEEVRKEILHIFSRDNWRVIPARALDCIDELGLFLTGGFMTYVLYRLAMKRRDGHPLEYDAQQYQDIDIVCCGVNDDETAKLKTQKFVNLVGNRSHREILSKTQTHPRIGNYINSFPDMIHGVENASRGRNVFQIIYLKIQPNEIMKYIADFDIDICKNYYTKDYLYTECPDRIERRIMSCIIDKKKKEGKKTRARIDKYIARGYCVDRLKIIN